MLQKIISILVLTVIIAICCNCAKISVPSGGPKDETPPKILSAFPVSKSTNFKEKKIILEFDEYIQIGNLQKSFNISPPLKNKPDFKLKGKSLVINLNNELRDSTTYTLSFGDGIADLNENNTIKNYQFVFSTGSYLDSMSVSGTVTDAFTLKPTEGYQILLHENLNDSAPKKIIPVYIDKVENTGKFVLNNLKSGTYKIYALKDANNNMIFDQAAEKFGFLDTVITTRVEIKEITDTLKNIEKKDSLVIRKIKKYFPEELKILTYEEENFIQFMTNNDRPENIKLLFAFKLPLVKNLELKPLNFSPPESWTISEKNLKNDTLIFWIKDTILGNTDTLKIELKYDKFASDGISIIPVSDTVTLKIKSISSKSKSKQPKLSLKTNIRNNGIHDLNIPVSFLCGHPISSFDTTFIKLFTSKDSTETQQKYILSEDSVAKLLTSSNTRKFTLFKQWDEEKTYKLKIFPGAFIDIYGNTNDTILLTFKTHKRDYYSSLLIKLKNVSSPVILQLLDSKETVLKETKVNADKNIKFEYLQPTKYNIKIIYDSNNNGKWDPGKYSEKRQPEKVLYYPSEFNLRSNWDVEQEWKIK